MEIKLYRRSSALLVTTIEQAFGTARLGQCQDSGSYPGHRKENVFFLVRASSNMNMSGRVIDPSPNRIKCVVQHGDAIACHVSDDLARLISAYGWQDPKTKVPSTSSKLSRLISTSFQPSSDDMGLFEQQGLHRRTRLCYFDGRESVMLVSAHIVGEDRHVVMRQSLSDQPIQGRNCQP